jgi:transcriptional regulator with XRE-family HTH domain
MSFPGHFLSSNFTESHGIAVTAPVVAAIIPVMARASRDTGAASVRVAANVRRLRTQRGMSTYELAKRLKAAGWPISATSITRLEQNERRADADDLLALAIVLGVTPNALLLPAEIPADDSTGMVVTGQTMARPADMWAWACGERPLALDGCVPVTGSAAALWAVEHNPHRSADVLSALSRRAG